MKKLIAKRQPSCFFIEYLYIYIYILATTVFYVVVRRSKYQGPYRRHQKVEAKGMMFTFYEIIVLFRVFL